MDSDQQFTRRFIESLDAAKVRSWLVDRQANCLRIAKGKTGDDRKGWLEDMAYFSAVIGMIDWTALEQSEPRP